MISGDVHADAQVATVPTSWNGMLLSIHEDETHLVELPITNRTVLIGYRVGNILQIDFFCTLQSQSKAPEAHNFK